MSTKRKYEFSWELLGDVEEGRPNLGNTTRVEVCRFTAKAVSPGKED